MTKLVDTTKTICVNRSIARNYVTLEKFEAGVILQGWEIKSIRKNNIQINKSYINFKDKTLVLINSVITPIDTICKSTHIDKKRQRPLLLRQEELKTIKKYKKIIGITVLPHKVFIKKNKIKITLLLVKHEKVYNKKNIKCRKVWLLEKKTTLC